MKALIIDDSPSSIALLEAHLSRWGYQVESASSGEDAWRILSEGGIRLVLCDWEMPGMDGPTLCRKIRSADLGHYVYMILFTGRSRSEDLVDGLSAGADDFVRKPLIPEELRLRLGAGTRILALEDKLESRNLALEKALSDLDAGYARLRADLSAAARLQASNLPPADFRLGEVRFTSLYRPSQYVAGDMFNYVRLNSTHTAFYMIDVAGHGVQAALHAVALHQWLTPDHLVDAGCAPLDPAQVLVTLNHHFQGHDEDTPYFTMIYGVLEEASFEISLGIAGHPAPLLLDGRGGLHPVGGPGYPVGLLPDATWESVHLSLRRDHDTLVLYTDGLAEALNCPGGDIAAQMDSLSHGDPVALRHGILGLLQHQAEQHDDISLVILSHEKEDKS
ncbi:PP2C family protein-serine/threonine phosphatase [Magnetospirillum sp. SS-4]|uniref:PP2C family protein-serine/threonine phosphatase n=1 Tax=Magnetospirillum sp. SS-4 TaxID=2681465 RepID=UPI00137DD738|nr:SpoIIE family protein phosphatase [Magnetospirillum sp. SS-4]CAA7621928.1 putative response regulator receiver protein [Magnetospirillum sp. SS-4]